MTGQRTGPASRIRPAGGRYRLIGISLGALLMFDLASFYGLVNVVALFSSGRPLGPWDVVNNSLIGLGFASYLIPDGLLAGWAASEASLGLAKLLSKKSPSLQHRRVLTAASTAVAALACATVLSLVFGLQSPYFYGIMVIVVFGVALLADPWLNRRAWPDRSD